MEADELTDIAEYYMTGKQDAKANQAIQAAIDMHPDSVDPQIFLARQRMFYGELDKARAIVDGITEQDDQEVIYIRAELLIKEDQANEASDFLLQKMETMHDSLDTYMYDCVSIFMDYDIWDLAYEWLEQLKDVCPDHPRLPIMEAEILMGLDRYEEALPQLQEILDNNPYDSEAWNLLAETHVALENYSEAVEAADYSLAINPEDSSALLMKANGLMNSGQIREAIDLYERYLELQPDDLNVHITLSFCYCTEKRYREALPLLLKAERLATQQSDKDAELSQILQLKAITVCSLNMFYKALSIIEDAKRITPEDLMWKCYLTEGDIYLQEDRADQAERCFADALDCCPSQPEALFSIAVSYMNAEYYKIAIDLFHDVWITLGTDDGKFVVPFIANCFLRLNDMKNFLAFLKQSASCNREATFKFFHDRFPNIAPEDYYAYAYKEVHGVFPDISDSLSD